MGGIYSGKSLISYKGDNSKSFINQKNGAELNLWKGNIAEYKKLKEKKDNVFYLISTPLNECLSNGIYNINGLLNEDIYDYINKKIESFSPDMSFRVTAIMDETKEYVQDFEFELLDIISYDDIYNKYLNNETITGAGLYIEPDYWGDINTQNHLESYIFADNEFKFIFAPEVYFDASSVYVKFYITLDENNNTILSYETI